MFKSIQTALIMSIKPFLIRGSIVATTILISSTFSYSQESWNGFYLGGQVTYSYGEKEIVGDRFTYNQNQSLVLVSHDYDGLGFSAFIGQNWRNDNFVYGLEASVGYANASSDLIFNPDNDYDQIDINWTAEFVGRIGAVSRASMIYVKGGLAVAEIRNIGGDTNAAGPDLNDRYLDESFHFGPIGGIGIEHETASGVILRLEGTLADYGDFSQTNNQNQTYRVSNGLVRNVSLGIVIPF